MLYKMIIFAGLLSSTSLLLSAEDASKQLMAIAIKPGHHDMTLLQHIDASDCNPHQAPKIKADRVASKTLTVIAVDPVASLHNPSKDQLAHLDYKKNDNPEKDQSIECLMCGKTITIYEIGTHLQKHELAFDPKAVDGAVKILKEDAL